MWMGRVRAAQPGVRASGGGRLGPWPGQASRGTDSRAEAPVSAAPVLPRRLLTGAEEAAHRSLCGPPTRVVPPACPRAICLVPSSPSEHARARELPGSGHSRQLHAWAPESAPRDAQGFGARVERGLGPGSPAAGPEDTPPGGGTLYGSPRPSSSGAPFPSCAGRGRWQGRAAAGAPPKAEGAAGVDRSAWRARAQQEQEAPRGMCPREHARARLGRAWPRPAWGAAPGPRGRERFPYHACAHINCASTMCPARARWHVSSRSSPLAPSPFRAGSLVWRCPGGGPETRGWT